MPESNDKFQNGTKGDSRDIATVDPFNPDCPDPDRCTVPAATQDGEPATSEPATSQDSALA